MAATPSANRTGSSTWRPQYGGSDSSAPRPPAGHVRHHPSRRGRELDSPPRPGRTPPPSAPSAASGRRGRPRGATRARLCAANAGARRRRPRRTAPETTVWRCAVDGAAIAEPRRGSSVGRPARGPPRPSRAGPTRPPSTPPAGGAPISRPRAATSARPSSGLMTPASVAATNSPTLWPSTTAGGDAPRLPELGQRPLEGEQRRLGEPVWSSARRPTTGHIEQTRADPATRSQHRSAAGRGRPGTTARPRRGRWPMPDPLGSLART